MGTMSPPSMIAIASSREGDGIDDLQVSLRHKLGDAHLNSNCSIVLVSSSPSSSPTSARRVGFNVTCNSTKTQTKTLNRVDRRSIRKRRDAIEKGFSPPLPETSSAKQ